MQPLCRRPQRLIESAYRSTAYFSSCTPLPRDFSPAPKQRHYRVRREERNERGNYRPDFERERHGRRNERDNILSRFDRGQRSNRRPRDSDDTAGLGAASEAESLRGRWQPRAASFTFKPNAGERFDRKDSKRAVTSNPRGPNRREEFLDELLPQWLDELEEIMYQEQVFKSLELEGNDLAEAFDAWSTGIREAIGQKTTSNADYLRFKHHFPSCHSTIMKLHLKYALYGHIVSKDRTMEELDDHKELADLRYPTEWFPATRGFQREFHLHVGPTNSGKTYHALKRLEQAETGLYAGPLRLLAHEVYMRLNASGSRCNLVTGDERRAADNDPDAPMTSCTVEMIPLNVKLGVAVIDEIQMIGSTDRGWAWTQAVLGVMAKEVHCCGEERAVPIMQELVAMCGEKLHVHRYKRLSPLEMSPQSLNGNLKRLQKGDCLVAFSVMEIHALRQEVEKLHKTKVAVIYGSLPPETRAQQAKLFNDPDSGYDILVASNAIGMGLNLSIKRLVFVAANKFDGAKWSTVSVAECKQIGGRAGRYSTATQDIQKATTNLEATSNLDLVEPTALQSGSAAARPVSSNVGYVTTLDKLDYPIVQRLMDSDPEPLVSAGIQPPTYIMERFARQFPAATPFAYLLIRLNDLARTSSRFFQCDLRTSLAIADCLEPITGLTTTDRLIFCASPIEPRKLGEPELGRAYARLVAESRAARIVDIDELDFNLLSDEYEATRQYLQKLESLHKGVIIWNWLSYRFAGVFIDRPLADHVKALVEERIEETLQRLSFDYRRIRRSRAQAIRESLAHQQPVEESEAARKQEMQGQSEDGQAGVASEEDDDQLHQQEEEALEDELELGGRMMELDDDEDESNESLDLRAEFGIDTGAAQAPVEEAMSGVAYVVPDRTEPDVTEQDESLIEGDDTTERTQRSKSSAAPDDSTQDASEQKRDRRAASSGA